MPNLKYLVSKDCEFCGNPFDCKRESHKFCSRDCRRKYRSEYGKSYRKNIVEKINKEIEEWVLNNPGKSKEEYEKFSSDKLKEINKWRQIRNKYGLTKDDYNSMLDSQNSRCLICTNILEVPYIDHDHKTGKVRGMLCMLCNVGLGSFGDSIENLYSAVNYLKMNK